MAWERRRLLVLWFFFSFLIIIVSFKMLFGIDKMRFDSNKVKLDLRIGLLLVMSPWAKQSRDDTCGKPTKKQGNPSLPDLCIGEEPKANEAANSSAEMLFSEAQPFGAHQFWCCLAPDAPEMKAMMESCSDALGILPATLMSDRRWTNMACSLNVTRKSFDPAANITIDFGQVRNG
jgi:hypothetical protein